MTAPAGSNGRSMSPQVRVPFAVGRSDSEFESRLGMGAATCCRHGSVRGGGFHRGQGDMDGLSGHLLLLLLLLLLLFPQFDCS